MTTRRPLSRLLSALTATGAALVGSTMTLTVSGLVAPAAYAQDTEIPPEEAQAHLTAQNDKLKEAFGLLPKRYGADPAKERTDIDKAKAVVDGVVAGLEGKHKAAPNAFAKLQSNVSRLRTQLQVAEKAHAVSSLQKEIFDLHRSGKPATEALWIKHDKALSAFSSGSGPGWQPVLAFFSEKAKSRRADQKRIETIEAETAKRAAAEAANDALQTARKEGNAERKKLQDAIFAANEPLPDAEFSAMIAAANAVAEQDPAGSEAYLTELRHLRAQNDFLLKKKAQGEAVATHLEGGFVTGGTARKSTTKLTVRAEANWCYGVVMRSTSKDTAAFKFVRAEWVAKKKPLQPWRVNPKSAMLYRIEGFCTLEKAKVSGKLITDKSPKKKLAYNIVGWPRKEVPDFLQTYLEVIPQDRCDFEERASLFESPVPGSAVRFQGQRYIITQVGGYMNDSVTLMDQNGERLQTTKAAVTASGQTDVPLLHKWRGCPDPAEAKAAASKKLGRCITKVEKKYSKKLAKAQRAIDKASSDAKREKAEAKLALLEDKESAERDNKCAPIEASLKEESAGVFTRVQGFKELHPRPTPTPRAKRLLSEAKIDFTPMN